MAGALVPMERQTRADVLKAISLNNEPDPTSQGPWSAASPYAAAAAANHAVPWPGMASSSSCSSGPRQEQEHIQNPPALQVQLSCALDAKPDEGWSNSMVLGGLNATATAEVALSCNPSHGIVQASPSLLQVCFRGKQLPWAATRELGLGHHSFPGLMFLRAPRDLSFIRPMCVLQVAVASLPIAGAAGTLALHLLPKFVLHNSLSVPLLWRQAGQSPGRPHTLPAGATVAVAWDRCPPAGQAWTPCVAVRVQEASWDWSSSFRIDSPGDVFVKLRHRVQDDAMLVSLSSRDLRTHFCLCQSLTIHLPAGWCGC